MNGDPFNDWTVPNMNLNIVKMEPLQEIDGFEPQTRARSNTWPLPRPENYVEPGDETTSNKCAVIAGPAQTLTQIPTKKNSSRRNAWGNLSYADLITQAITSSPDKRLTLSQIYEWMVQNVPYFKDKGDSNSSAGWKNSIRHNLSLHNRFMRVQNEGTGKSSWWMINPDAKPGKSVRRRAASMETSKFEKRRGRVKKKVEMMRNGLLHDTTPSPSSSISEGLDKFPDSPIHSGGFQQSPDFRPRASSNTSSCGRLSPIPSVAELDTDWGSPSYSSNYSPELVGNYSPDQLAGNLQQGMKLEPDYIGYINGPTPSQPPPPYSATFEHFPGRTLHATSPYGVHQCPIHRMQTCVCMPIKVERMSPTGMSPSYPHSEPSSDSLGTQFMLGGRNTIQRPSSSSPPSTSSQSTTTPHNNTTIASTMMGQLMGALNQNPLVDDLNIDFHGGSGFDCNVEELIKHELNMDGTLDFNFQNQPHQGVQLHQENQSGLAVNQTNGQPSYSASVTTPSWVH